MMEKGNKKINTLKEYNLNINSKIKHFNVLQKAKKQYQFQL